MACVDVFDVYVEYNREKVYLVDFNPFCPTTDSIMYDWEELMNCKIIYRFIIVDINIK